MARALEAMPAPPPDDWELRPLQKEILEANERFKVACLHRRYGKTVLAVEYLIEGWQQCNFPNYRGWYVMPFASQGEQVAWMYIVMLTGDIEGMHYDKRELVATFPNGGTIRLVGAEQYNRHRGKYGDRCVFDEVSDIPPAAWRQVFRPMLSDRIGGALFIGTPRGHDWFKDLYDNGQRLDGWRGWHKTVYETGVIDPAEIMALQAEMLPDEFRREYLCDWDVAAHGAFYQRQINQLIQGGRSADCVYSDDELVHSAWWLDHSDQITVTLWQQQKRGQLNCIGSEHVMNGSVADMIEQLNAHEYFWGQHHCPHVIKPGSPRWKAAKDRGFYLKPNPVKVELMDRIEHVKGRLASVHMDSVGASNLLEAGRQYRAEFDEKRQILKPGHLENLSARYCESMGVFMLGHNERRSDWSTPIEYPERFRA